eukprot:4394555-Pyramimonas_sp.AAC.1
MAQSRGGQLPSGKRGLAVAPSGVDARKVARGPAGAAIVAACELSERAKMQGVSASARARL